MFRKNKELRIGLILLGGSWSVLSWVGFWIGTEAGILVLAMGMVTMAVHISTEYYRYRKLQKLSDDLDRLLVGGAPLPIQAYREGELSILTNHIEKLTLRLKEAAEITRKEKCHLADSLADISHQLRTPLTAMNLTTAMLREPGLREDKRMELTAELRKLLIRTDWLVETLLKLSKLDAGTVKLAPKTVDAARLIQRAAEPVAIAMELRNQTLQVFCQAQTLECDLVWTAEALGNILKNCMEHTPEGGSITVTVSQTALYTQIEVTDTGSGLDEKDIPHLFERFYKGSNAAENSYGIGLALARTVITAQNGTVQAGNAEKGARFVIKFYRQVI